MAAKLSSRLGKDKVIVLEPAEVSMISQSPQLYLIEYLNLSSCSATITSRCLRSLEAA